MTGAFALAWVLGFVVVAAPAGLGARELALGVAAAPVVGVTGAAALAVLLRVVHTLGDVGLALAAGAWRGGEK